MKLTIETIKKVYGSKLVTIETMKLRGYELIHEYFVDSSGFGCEDEPALTTTSFERELSELIEKEGPLYATITRQGQFQVYVGLFRKGKKVSKRIAANTYQRDTDQGYTIRLYDTDIVTRQGDTWTLDTGGFNTSTTFRRMNEALKGTGFTFGRHNWEPVAYFNGGTRSFTDNKIILKTSVPTLPAK